MEQPARTIIVVWSWAASGVGAGTWGVDDGGMTANKVVCQDIRATADGALDQLKQLLETHTADGGDVMLFLHRHHGYEQQHTSALLALPLPTGHGQHHCFLFGEGADPIYLTNNPRGLLGISGTFAAQLSRGDITLPLTAIADANRRLLRPAHFDYVWQLYERAIARSIFELREDLLSFLCQQLPKTTFASGDLYALVSVAKQRLLLLRLLSFVGRVRKSSALAIELRGWERRHNRTYTFDDCEAQLSATYGPAIAAQHATLAAYLLKHVLAKGEPVYLPELRDQFDALLQAFPEKSYHI